VKNPCVSALHTRVPGSRQQSPTGFTLVELLVVIGIIALLAALVTPAVMRSMSTARAAAVKTEIDLLSTALMTYKNEYGSFPPADMRGLWDDGNKAVDKAHPVYKHLKRAFPRLSEPEGLTASQVSPYYFMAQMSPAQALVFWLQGFYENPQFPLTNGVPLTIAAPRSGDAQGSRRKLFDFDDKRLYAASEGYFPALEFSAAHYGDPQSFKSRNNANGFAREYPVYFPNIPNAGVPFVYFPSSCYSAGPGGPVKDAISSFGATPPVFYYHAVGTNGEPAFVSPYFNSNPPAQPTFAQLHQNPDTFQLIAGGADGSYGASGIKVPSFPAAIDPALTFNSQSIGPLPSVTQAQGNEDNITNFASGPLKAAAEKLLAQ
jgi:prepilin-type N-terminal cleavage/methylation domain-containing protein